MAVAEKLHNMRVRWFMDNQNVVRILKGGSGKPDVQVEALRVFKACVANNIRLDRARVGSKREKPACRLL